MSLIDLRGITIGFGTPLLLDGADVQIEKGERLCILGRNGAGKSTLMKVLSGQVLPDRGTVWRSPGLKTAMLEQEVPMDLHGAVFDVVTAGLGDVHDRMMRYHAALAAVANGCDGAMDELEKAHHELEAAGAWSANQRVETVISRLKLPADAEFSELSGGFKRRVLLARALVTEPDVLLLDEPTNHLDIESIGWLEEFLLGYRGTVVFVTHDRMLLGRLATRILEIDRGRAASWQCDYKTFMERKDSLLASEAQQNALFDKKLAEEEAWVRQGIKARRTRNEGRVRALIEMRKERLERRDLEGRAKISSTEAEASGRLVIEARKVSYAYDSGKEVIKAFSTMVMRGDKVGIIGANGSGKTTLLKLLLGKLAPTSGTVRLGARLEVSYFDQHRAGIDPEKTVQENIGGGNDHVIIDGKPRHVIGYLQDFLFSASRSRTPVKALSGGERNRLLLARLFTKPSNVLVMDEPTNDLDAETLELLEELLTRYSGTVLLVSHDRAFLNNIATSTIVFEKGGLCEYVGGYDDWLSQRPKDEQAPVDPGPRQARPKRERQAKISFKEERELKELPSRIEALETEQVELYELMSRSDFYQQGGDKAASVKARLSVLEQEIKDSYCRWEALEALKASSS